MANLNRGEMFIEFDGQTRLVKFTNNLIAEAEEILGQGIFSVFQKADRVMLSVSFVRALLYVGLKGGGARYTLEQVGDAIEFSKLPQLTERIANLLVAYMRIEDMQEPQDGAQEKKPVIQAVSQDHQSPVQTAS